MAKIIVIQHVPYEPLGTMNTLFKEKSIRIKYINFGRDKAVVPSLDGYDGLVILGGPMNVDQVVEYPNLQTEVELIQQAMARQLPILGICLGAQLVAKASGVSVRQHNSPEIGWYDIQPTDIGKQDLLLRHFSASQKIFQWHGDTFDLPEQAVLLATGDGCHNQAYRIGENVYGFQFHLEVDRALIERWLTLPQHQAELNSLANDIDPRRIRVETEAYMDQNEALSRQVFGAFVDLIGHREPIRLRSR